MTQRLLTLCLLLPLCGQAQLTQTLRGRVVDKESKYPLVGATVQVVDASLGNLTDTTGAYRIGNVPVGRRTVRVTLVGYKEVLLNNIIVDAGRETILDVDLEEGVQQLSTLTVRAQRTGEARNDMAVVSARQFSVEEADRYAGSRGEPARMAANFAGVQGADDSRNDIVIRGNSPQGVLWRLEGVSIPNPNHFAIAGTSGGPVSIINNRYLANSDFFTGAFPAEFGNTVAGVFDLKLRNGNNERHEKTIQFGFLGTEAMVEGPLSRKTGASYMVSYRYANLGLFSKLGLDIGTQAIPAYQDGFFRLNFPLKDRAGVSVGSISLWALGGTSTVDILISQQKADDRNIFGQNDRDQYFTSRMGVAGLTYIRPVSRQTFWKTTLAVSGNAQAAKDNYLFLRKDKNGNPLVQDSRFVIDSLRPTLDYQFTEIRYTLSTLVNHKLSARSTLKLGINADLFQFTAYDSVRTLETATSTLFTPWRSRWAANETFALVQPYVSYRNRLTDNLTLTAGLNALILTLNANSVSPLEPRLGMSYDLPNRQKISVAIGLHSQMQPTYTYFYKTPDFASSQYPSPLVEENRTVGLTKSWHYVASYNRLLGRNMRLLVETYYQQLFNVPVERARSSFSMVNTGAAFSRIFPGPLVNTGTGRNYGVELTLEKFFSNTYYFLVTGSLFDARYQGSDDVWRNTDFNGTYALNLLVAKEIPFRRSSLNIGAKFTTTGGRWYGPVNEAASRQNQEIVFASATRNSLQFAPYRRFDVKIDYKINRKRLTHTIAFDLVNVLGIQNLLSLSYAPQPDGTFVKQEYQLGFLPIFYYRVNF
ncbi:TonB-dependent receptor [Fibrella sp. HMF5335]|uniref:TonB-dependent receptor n=1 Tax=Fibrella rubiginis TaxID=2817060 RepID=A0A939GGF7_9BACT|nr:TonB-dependent receptor [Fibrella rubiginis]MBO0936764.1 TonB-dependent receptor [Fibrella rubiginis]